MFDGGSPIDAELERELTDLGPLMLRQEAALREGPGDAFARDLRARLVGGAGAQPDARTRRRFPVWRFGALGGLAAAAVLVVLLVLGRSGSKGTAPSVAFVPPTPGRADLTKSYPLLGGLGAGGPIEPTQSRIDLPRGGPYTGRLTLSAGPLPTSANEVRAHRLAGASFDAPRITALAETFGIHAAVHRRQGYQYLTSPPQLTTWSVVAQGGTPSRQPVHSLAISLTTGELIYHDVPAEQQRYSRRLTAAAAEMDSRAWLARAGWPAARMAVQSARPLFGGSWEVRFGWDGVPSSDWPAATLWVTPDGIVTEALVLPPVKDTASITGMSFAAAWKLIREHRIPVGVLGPNGLTPYPPSNGTGSVARVTVTQILTVTRTGALYLVPAYRFEGRVRLGTPARTYTWLALVPAARP